MFSSPVRFTLFWAVCFLWAPLNLAHSLFVHDSTDPQTHGMAHQILDFNVACRKQRLCNDLYQLFSSFIHNAFIRPLHTVSNICISIMTDHLVERVSTCFYLTPTDLDRLLCLKVLLSGSYTPHVVWRGHADHLTLANTLSMVGRLSTEKCFNFLSHSNPSVRELVYYGEIEIGYHLIEYHWSINWAVSLLSSFSCRSTVTRYIVVQLGFTLSIHLHIVQSNLWIIRNTSSSEEFFSTSHHQPRT